jgi:acetaldehyde dehydrogenase (acetylating)
MARFQKYITTLQRGTGSALEFAAMSTGRLVSAKAIEPFLLPNPPSGTPYAGLVWLVVDDGTGSGVLDPTVKTAVQNAVFGYTATNGTRVPGWKAAGVQVAILPVAPVPIKVRATVRVTPFGASRWSTIQTNLTASVQTYFAGLQVEDPVSYSNLLVALAGADPDIIEVSLAMWQGDRTAPAYSAPIVAQDLLAALAGNPYTGANERAIPLVGPAIDGGASVNYPEWLMTT